MKAITSKDFPISPAACFGDGVLRPDALLDFMQDVAGYHAECIGIGAPVMYEQHNALWMLVRIWYRLDRPLRDGENVTIETWPMPPEGMSSNRGFYFFVDGEKVGEAYQVWVLVDAKKRAICRLRNIPELQLPDYCDRPPLAKLRRLTLPEPLEQCSICRVQPSDIDTNGHMNNTRYMAYVMDALGGGFVQELHINYDHECVAGEQLTLLTGREEDRTYVVGKKDDHAQSFEVMLRIV